MVRSRAPGIATVAGRSAPGAVECDDDQPLSPTSRMMLEAPGRCQEIFLQFVFEDVVGVGELRGAVRDSICKHPRFHRRVVSG